MVLSSMRRLLSLPLNAAKRFAIRAPRRPPTVKSISIDPSLFCFKAARQTPPIIGIRQSHFAVEIFLPYLRRKNIIRCIKNGKYRSLHEGSHHCSKSRFSSFHNLSKCNAPSSQSKHRCSMSTSRADPSRKHANKVIHRDLRGFTGIGSHPEEDGVDTSHCKLSGRNTHGEFGASRSIRSILILNMQNQHKLM